MRFQQKIFIKLIIWVLGIRIFDPHRYNKNQTRSGTRDRKFGQDYVKSFIKNGRYAYDNYERRFQNDKRQQMMPCKVAERKITDDKRKNDDRRNGIDIRLADINFKLINDPELVMTEENILHWLD